VNEKLEALPLLFHGWKNWTEILDVLPVMEKWPKKGFD
jgi:hypothetical protein